MKITAVALPFIQGFGFTFGVAAALLLLKMVFGAGLFLLF